MPAANAVEVKLITGAGRAVVTGVSIDAFAVRKRTALIALSGYCCGDVDLAS
jgi:hypothetical protein